MTASKILFVVQKNGKIIKTLRGNTVEGTRRTVVLMKIKKKLNIFYVIFFFVYSTIISFRNFSKKLQKADLAVGSMTINYARER